MKMRSSTDAGEPRACERQVGRRTLVGPSAIFVVLTLVFLAASMGSARAAEKRSAAAGTRTPEEPSPAKSGLREALAAAEDALKMRVPEAALAKISLLDAAGRRSVEARSIQIRALVMSGDFASALAIRSADLNAPEVLHQLGVASFAMGHRAEALSLFDRAYERGKGDASLIGAALAHRELGNLGEAIKGFSAVPAGPLRIEAMIRLAETGLSVDDPAIVADALKDLQTNPDVPQAAVLYMEGVRLLTIGNAVPALEKFRAAQAEATTTPTPRSVAPSPVGLLLGIVSALTRAGKLEEALAEMDLFIENNPRHPQLADLFEQREGLIPPSVPSPTEDLRKWALAPEKPRKTLAVRFLARAEARAGRADRAVNRLKDLLSDFPEDSGFADTVLFLAEAHLEEGHFKEALEILGDRPSQAEATDAWTRFLRGRALFGLGRFDEAFKAFNDAGKWKLLRETALYNAAICGMRVSAEGGLFERSRSAFEAEFPASPLIRDLAIENAIFAARRGLGPGPLEDFAKRFPNHPRLGESFIARAELAIFGEARPPSEALDLLVRGRELGLSPELQDRADYLELWIADALSSQSRDEVLRFGLSLAARQPPSRFLPEIRLKLGQMFHDSQDFLDARNQFELAARESTNSRLADEAFFLAGRSAMRLMDERSLADALELLKEVGEENSMLRKDALRLQAEVQRLLGSPASAIAVLDEILRSSQLPPRERLETQLTKAEFLLEIGQTEPRSLVEAIPLLREVAKEAGGFVALRNQALFLLGGAFERIGQGDQALSAFYDVLRSSVRGVQETEYFWFYKAGFEAARLLEERGSHRSAFEVYAQLADTDGNGAKEARRRMNQLQLEHFLWQKE